MVVSVEGLGYIMTGLHMKHRVEVVVMHPIMTIQGQVQDMVLYKEVVVFPSQQHGGKLVPLDEVLSPPVL
jgi:phenylacetate-coenzyme A ligase PaaK-like adenylate-forming protein